MPSKFQAKIKKGFATLTPICLEQSQLCRVRPVRFKVLLVIVLVTKWRAGRKSCRIEALRQFSPEYSSKTVHEDGKVVKEVVKTSTNRFLSRTFSRIGNEKYSRFNAFAFERASS